MKVKSKRKIKPITERDIEVIQFLHDRLENVYKENSEVGYLTRTREIIKKLKEVFFANVSRQLKAFNKFADDTLYYYIKVPDEIVDKYCKTLTNKAQSFADVMPCVPYQLCPKCNGQGQLTKPPYVAGDQYTWSSSSAIHQCDVCNGMKIIPMHIKCDEILNNN